MAEKWFVTDGGLVQKITILFIILLLVTGSTGYPQVKGIDKKEFFSDERVIEMTLVADFKKIIREKLKKDYRKNFMPATITCIFPDSTKVTKQLR